MIEENLWIDYHKQRILNLFREMDGDMANDEDISDELDMDKDEVRILMYNLILDGGFSMDRYGNYKYRFYH